MLQQYSVATKPLALTLLWIIFVPDLLTADELQVSRIFTDHAVIQRGVEFPVWGTTQAGSEVTVRFAGQSKTARAKPDGSWQVLLAPLPANNSGSSMIVESAEHRKEFRDLLVGEVWYASGQSNMQMRLDACAKKIDAIRKIAEAPATTDIRLIRINDIDSPEPLSQLQTSSTWQVDNPTNRGKQSAVAYFFARQLNAELDVPIGIIEGSWGGKPVEGFIPRDQFQTHDALRPILELAEQDKLQELAALQGGVIVRNTAGMPARIFNARVMPIAPFAIRGFIWYQGESNAGRGEDPRNYRIKMRALIDGWRKTWNQSKLPFYFVQLPAFKDEVTGWVRLREEQRRSLEIPHTGMAVTIDLRDSDIHPSNKLDVGKRLARWALANTYEKNLSYSGPLFKSATVENNSMRIAFDHADDGLMIARKQGIDPPMPTPNVPLAHFEVADATGKWHPAQATIVGSTIRVSSPLAKSPQAVRYACSGDPKNANLYSQAGLPASPFCSDLRLLPWSPPTRSTPK